MKKKLQQSIFTAFEAVPYPGDDNIGHPLGRDDAEDVAEAFRGLDWRSLVSKRLNGIALLFMTPEALHYYLPAYLISAIEDFGGEAMSGLCFCLRPEPCESGVVKEKQELSTSDSLLPLLSSGQKQAIVDVLTYGQKERLNFLLRERKIDLSREIHEDGDPITDQEKENDRIYWDRSIETVLSDFGPVIEYWKRV